MDGELQRKAFVRGRRIKMHEAIEKGMDNGVYSVYVGAQCDLCKERRLLIIPDVEWRAWTHGGLIQKVMPSLNKENRELLISGTCSACFDSIAQI
jgi:hypothetical protein